VNAFSGFSQELAFKEKPWKDVKEIKKKGLQLEEVNERWGKQLIRES